MPRIFTYEQQTTPGGRLTAPESSGSGAAGLLVLGRGVERLADVALQNRESEALAEAHAAGSRARGEWAKHLFERSQAAESGAPNFTPTLLKDFDDYRAKALPTAKTPRAKAYLAEQLDAVRGDLELKALHFEAGARISHRVGLFEQATDNLRIAVRADPTQFDSAVASQGAALDATDLPAAERDRLWAVTKEQLGIAAVTSAIEQRPGATLKALRSAPGKSGSNAIEALSPEARERAISAAESEVRRLEAEARSRAAEARMSLAEAEADAFAAKAAGLDAELPSKGAYLAAYGADGAKRHAEKSKLMGIYDTVSAAVLLPPAEGMALVAQYRPTEQEGAAEAARTAAAAEGLYDRQRQAFEEDPAAVVMARDPSVVALLEAATGPQATRDDVAAYVAKVQAPQRAAGIVAPRVLPLAYAEQVAAQLQFNPQKPEARTQNLQALRDQWGKYFPLVLKDVAPKMDGTARVLVGMTPDQGKRLDAALASGKDLGKTLPKRMQNDVTEQLRSEFEPFAETLVDNVDFADRYAEHFEAAQTLAFSLAAQGESVREAARHAAAAVVNDQYVYADRARIPKSQAVGQILFGAEVAKAEAVQSERLSIQASTFSDDAQAQVDLKSAIARGGYWVTNEDQTGLVLMVPTHRGASAVRTSAGRYEFDWQQLAELGVFGTATRDRVEAEQ